MNILPTSLFILRSKFTMLLSFLVFLTVIVIEIVKPLSYDPAIQLVENIEKRTNEAEICRTRILCFSQGVNSEIKFPKVASVIILRLSIISNPFNLESTVLRTLMWYFKYTKACSVVFLPKLDDGISSRTLQELVQHKLCRLHIDYFLFTFNKFQSVENYNSSYNDLYPSISLEDIRYYYILNEDTIELIKDSCTFQHPIQPTIYQNRCNNVLNGKKIRTVMARNLPYLRFKNITEDGQIIGGGGQYYYAIIDAMKRYNFTYTFQISSGGGSTGYKKDSKWYGSIGDIMYGQNDIALGSAITSDRYEVIQCGSSLEVGKRLFFAKLSLNPLTWKSILLPFQPYLWYSLIASIFFVALSLVSFLACTERAGPIFILKQLLNVFLDVISILLDQGVEKIWNVKFMMILWLFTSLIIGAGYRSKLIFFLTFKSTIKLPKSHFDLIDQNYKLHFAYYAGVAYKVTKDSTDPIQQEILKRSLLVNTSDQCIIDTIISEEKAVCLDWDIIGDLASFRVATINVRQPKNLIVKIDDDPIISGIWIPWMYKRMSPFTQTFDEYLLSRFASGIFGKWIEQEQETVKLKGSKWLNDLSFQSTIKEKIISEYEAITTLEVQPLRLDSLTGVFFVIILTVIVGTLAFLVELLVFLVPYKFQC